MLQVRANPDNVNAAFSRQSSHFDEDDFSNEILRRWREQVYTHIDGYIKPNSSILELNAGTGIDAVRLAQRGHTVHATDLSDGMIETLEKKVIRLLLQEKITVQQVSFENLDLVNGKYDFIFSNFGGLNCLEDLSTVAHQLPNLLNKGGHLTWVIMPPVCLWEWSWILKGQFKKAFRRLNKKTLAHLEGEYFATYYHSVNDIKRALGKQFKLVCVEGLGVFSPPPSATDFVSNHKTLTKFLIQLDLFFLKRFPFNRWGDHLMVTFVKFK